MFHTPCPRWLHNLKNPTGRLARWSLSLSEYDFDIVHRKGSSHLVPDALSRMYEPLDSEEIFLIKDPIPSWYTRRFQAVSDFPERFPIWKIIDNRLYHYRPNLYVTDFVDDLDGWKLVPSDKERESVLMEAHDGPQSGHLGTQKTYALVSRAHYWPGYCRDVNKYANSCITCQMCKVEQKVPAGLMGHRVVEEAWMVVAADIMGPLPRSKIGFQYILVIQDLFTKWKEVIPLRVATGKKIESAFRECILNRWGHTIGTCYGRRDRIR